MAIVLKDKITDVIYDVISLKNIEPEKIPVIVKNFEEDYIVIRKKEV